MTDVEGSTRLLEEDPTAVWSLVRCREIVIEAASTFNGDLPPDQGEGDSTMVVFETPSAAVACAVAIQRNMRAALWPTATPLRVRIGIHTGDATLIKANYYGLTVHRAARIRSAGHGGQILLSAATAELVADALAGGARLEDLGAQRLKDLSSAERIFRLHHPSLRPPTCTSSPKRPPYRMRSRAVSIVLGIAIVLASVLSNGAAPAGRKGGGAAIRLRN